MRPCSVTTKAHLKFPARHRYPNRRLYLFQSNLHPAYGKAVHPSYKGAPNLSCHRQPTLGGSAARLTPNSLQRKKMRPCHITSRGRPQNITRRRYLTRRSYLFQANLHPVYGIAVHPSYKGAPNLSCHRQPTLGGRAARLTLNFQQRKKRCDRVAEQPRPASNFIRGTGPRTAGCI